MMYLGVDPGAKGAVVILNSSGDVESISDFSADPMYYVDAVKDCLWYYKTRQNGICYIEDVHALPSQSSVAGFTFGVNVGMAKVLANTIAAIVKPVTPMKWKRFFNLRKDAAATKTEFKHLSVDLAKLYFPKAAPYFVYSRDGRAEAALIALYGYLQETGTKLEEFLKSPEKDS